MICLVAAIGIKLGITHSQIEIEDEYALKEAAKASLDATSQEAFIEQVVCDITLVKALNEDEKDYDEIADMLRNNYPKVAEKWSSRDGIPQTLEEESAQFYLILMDCYLGSQNYSSYAEGKDALKVSGEKIASAFEKEKTIDEALYISESKFKALYDLGKHKQLESCNLK